MSNKHPIPDLSRYDLYLYLKQYREQQGYHHASIILLADLRGTISDDDAESLGFIRLLRSQTAVLYALMPINGKHINANQLLRQLGLGNVAGRQYVTKDELKKQFYEICNNAHLDLSLLDNTHEIGFNADGHMVTETRSGRFLTTTSGVTRDANLQQLLYAVDSKGEIVESQADYCARGLLGLGKGQKNLKIDPVDAEAFNQFVLATCRMPPPIPNGVDPENTICFYPSLPAPSINLYYAPMVEAVYRVEAEYLINLDLTDDTKLDEFCQFNRSRTLDARPIGFKPDMPAGLLARLARLVCVEVDEVLCEEVGNLPMLALLVNLRKRGHKITASEQYNEQRAKFNKFLGSINSDFQVLPPANNPTTKSVVNLTYLDNGTSHSPVLIDDTPVYQKSVVHLMQILEGRDDNGRTIAIADVDDLADYGYISADSRVLMDYLHNNYLNVQIFDVSPSLSSPARYHSAYRVFLIGHRVEAVEAPQLTPDKLNTLTEAEQFDIFVSSYISNIEDMEISQRSFMDSLSMLDEDAESKNLKNTKIATDEDSHNDEPVDKNKNDEDKNKDKANEQATGDLFSTTNEDEKDEVKEDKKKDDESEDDEDSTTSGGLKPLKRPTPKKTPSLVINKEPTQPEPIEPEPEPDDLELQIDEIGHEDIGQFIDNDLPPDDVDIPSFDVNMDDMEDVLHGETQDSFSLDEDDYQFDDADDDLLNQVENQDGLDKNDNTNENELDDNEFEAILQESSVGSIPSSPSP